VRSPPTFDPRETRAAVGKGLWSVAATVAALGLGLLAASQHPAAATALRDLVDRASPGHLLLATALMSVAFIIMGLRWRSLMPPPPPGAALPGPGGLTLIILAGLMLNYAVPGPFGELAAAWFAHRRYGLSLADATASGIGARLIGLASASLLAALIPLLSPLPLPPSLARGVLVGAGGVGLCGLLLLVFAARPDPLLRLARACARPFLGLPLIGRLTARALAAGEALAEAARRIAARGPRALLPALGWSTLGHLTVITGIAVAVEGLGADWSLAGVAFTYAITTAGAVLLFALPGSQFGWDLLFATLLSTAAGLTWVDAVATASLVRGQQLLFMLAGAGATAVLLRAALPGGGPPSAGAPGAAPPAEGTQAGPPAI